MPTNKGATEPPGFTQAKIGLGRVTKVHPDTWTVDVQSMFDRMTMDNVQVGSGYLHWDSGEGMYAMPEEGATCAFCIPGDSTAPFVLAFFAPLENTGDNNASKASFAAGRDKPTPGDLVMRGRDGNRVVLHRGGVLEIGSTELCQRIFFPLNDRMLDVSGTYEHLNAGGGVRWGLQEGPSNQGFLHSECYRILKNDKKCDIRIQVGHIKKPTGEPDSGGEKELIAKYSLNTPFMEVTLASGGFDDLGQAHENIRNMATLRLYLDKTQGGAFLRGDGVLLASFKQGIHLKTEEDLVVEAKNVMLKTSADTTIGGGASTNIRGDVVRLADGTSPIARQGDSVTVTAVGVAIVPNPAIPGTFLLTGVLTGQITGGRTTLLG